MEQWRQILNSYADSDEVSILDSDVTGIKGSNSVPDGVFYSEFLEEEAIAYYNIFDNFAHLYSINSRIAIFGLEDDLNTQNAAVRGIFCPVELILFSSRYVNSIIESDPKVFKKLKIIIGRLLNKDADKIAHYILGGWEWKTQLSIFVEAIGAAAPNLVDIAMEYYPQIASMCIDDKSVLKSYINMLIATQDISFADYFSDIVTNEVFMNDKEVIDHFYKSLTKDPYWKTEGVSRQIIEEIEGDTISPILRKRITDLKRRFSGVESSSEFTIHGMLNSRNVDYETKVVWANKLRFVGACASDIYEWERIKDHDASMLVNRMVMENIDSITPAELRGRAYFTLATHCKKHKDEVIEFLLDQKENNPEFGTSVNIALFELRVVSSDELFTSLFSENYQDYYGKNMGKYFRYNRVAVSKDFMSFINRYFKKTLNESSLDRGLMILYRVLENFTSKDGMLADETLGIDDATMQILLKLSGDYDNSSTYNSFMDVLDLIAKESPSNRSDVLKILYKLKDIVSKKNMLSIESRIDSDIKRYDAIVAPTGH